MVYPNLSLLAEVKAYLAAKDPALAAKLARYTKVAISIKTYHATDIAAGTADIITLAVAEGEAYVFPLVFVYTQGAKNIEGDKLQVVDKAATTVVQPMYVGRHAELDCEKSLVRLDFILLPVDEYKVQYVGEGAIAAAHLTVQLVGFRLSTM